MENYVIGLDYGSDSVRALLVDAADGRELADCVFYYPRWKKQLYCDSGECRFRQHPLDYLEGLEYTVKGVLAAVPGAADKVRGIAIDTTGSTPCVTDEKGMPLALHEEFSEDPDAMFVLWKDHTAVAEADRINHLARTWGGEDYTRYEGGIYSPEWFWAKLIHVLENNEKVAAAAYSFVEHCDWITGVLCGNIRPETIRRSRCAAGHKAMWHASWGGLPPEEFLVKLSPRLAGFRSRLYNETVTADVCSGKLCPEWAAKLGLSGDVAVGGSGFDAHFGAVGGGVGPGSLCKVMGTSTCDIAVAPHEEVEGKLIRGICGQVDGSVIPGFAGLEAGQSAFGDVYAFFRNLLCWPLDEFSVEGSEELEGKIIPRLEREAVKIAPSLDNPAAVDWFNGRRTPDVNPKVRGAIYNLKLGATAPMIYRALAESTVFGARAIVERMESEGVKLHSVIALGGIAKKSELIMQMCADILNMPVKVVRSSQACALGSAMFAAVAAKLYPDVMSAMAGMSGGYEKIYNPDPSKKEIYDKLYQRYCEYSAALEKEVMKNA